MKKKKHQNRSVHVFLFSLLTLQTGNLFSYEKIVKHPDTINGEKEYAQGNYDKAIEYFNKAISEDEPRGEPYFFIGSIYELRKDYDNAIIFFEESIRHELEEKFRKAALWKLVILFRNKQQYVEMLTYISLLEESGVTHRNLDKFREEGQLMLSPEKVEARLLIIDAHKQWNKWREENPDAEFWDQPPDTPVILHVLESYEKAISLDDSFFQKYWDLASWYEKTGMLDKAEKTYRKIIYRDNSPQAAYKLGVILRKKGDYKQAAQYLEQVVSRMKEDEQLLKIQYYILINYSQSLYALGDNDKGISYSLDAIKLEPGSKEKITMGKILYCLHLFKEEVKRSNDLEPCLAIIGSKEERNLDYRIRSLYNYMIGEYYRNNSLQKPQQELEDKLDKNQEDGARYYSSALLPPRLRNGSLVGVQLNAEPDSYTIQNQWAPIPEWARVSLPVVTEYLFTLNKPGELYLVVLIYKNELSRSDNYNRWLFHGYLGTGHRKEALQIATSINNKTFEENQLLLDLYLWEKDYTAYQEFFLEVYKKNPHERKTMIENAEKVFPFNKIKDHERKENFFKLFDKKTDPSNEKDKEKNTTPAPETKNDSDPATENETENQPTQSVEQPENSTLSP